MSQELPRLPMADLMQEITLPTISVLRGVEILGTIQLALRHPGTKELESRKGAEAFARLLQDEITKKCPSLNFLCEAGWNERFDQ